MLTHKASLGLGWATILLTTSVLSGHLGCVAGPAARSALTVLLSRAREHLAASRFTVFVSCPRRSQSGGSSRISLPQGISPIYVYTQIRQMSCLELPETTEVENVAPLDSRHFGKILPQVNESTVFHAQGAVKLCLSGSTTSANAASSGVASTM